MSANIPAADCFLTIKMLYAQSSVSVMIQVYFYLVGQKQESLGTSRRHSHCVIILASEAMMADLVCTDQVGFQPLHKAVLL